MKRKGWLIFDFFLAIIISILGKFVADYLKDRYGLIKPNRIFVVIVLFFIALGISLTITLLKQKDRADQKSDKNQMNNGKFYVHQQIKELYGKLIGVKSQRIMGGIFKVKQKISKIGNGGSATGVEVTENIGDSKIEVEQKVNKVDKGGELIGRQKNK